MARIAGLSGASVMAIDLRRYPAVSQPARRPIDPRRLLRAERRLIVVLLLGAVASGGLFGMLMARAQDKKERAIAAFDAVQGSVIETAGDSSKIWVSYEHRGQTFQDSFFVVQAGPYDPGQNVRLVVNPQNSRDAHLVGERLDFLSKPTAMLCEAAGWAALALTAAGLVCGLDWAAKSRLLRQYPMRTMTVRRSLGSRAVVPDSEPGLAYEASGVSEGSFGVAGPMSPEHRAHSVFVSPEGKLTWAKGPYPAARVEDRRPSAEQIRGIATGAGNPPGYPDAPLTAQPVLLVHRRSGLIFFPDGSIAGAVEWTHNRSGGWTHRNDTSTGAIVDRDGQVVVSMEAPYQFLEARGLVRVIGGAGQDIGLTKERGRLRRDLYLDRAGPRMAKFRRRSTNGATITDSAGQVVADVTRHRVAVPGRRFRTSVLLVTFTPTDGPAQLVVFANALTAFSKLVETWGGGGG